MACYHDSSDKKETKKKTTIRRRILLQPITRTEYLHNGLAFKKIIDIMVVSKKLILSPIMSYLKQFEKNNYSFFPYF